jgi:hypothetical protein
MSSGFISKVSMLAQEHFAVGPIQSEWTVWGIWINDNCGGFWSLDLIDYYMDNKLILTYYFTDEGDAVLFRLAHP